MKKEQCQVEGCQSLTLHALYKTYPDGTKRWLHVCKGHEGRIGDENMQRAAREVGR